jgi:hypothetical protein
MPAPTMVQDLILKTASLVAEVAQADPTLIARARDEFVRDVAGRRTAIASTCGLSPLQAQELVEAERGQGVVRMAVSALQVVSQRDARGYAARSDAVDTLTQRCDLLLNYHEVLAYLGLS